jgi:hypothetical protein
MRSETMRATMTALGLILLATPVWAQSPAPPQLPALNATATPDVTLAVSTASHSLEVGAAAVLTLGADAVTCTGSTPASCPAPPVVGAFVDSTAAWSATRLDGRVLIVRNAGPGVVSLVGEDAEAPSVWRLQTGRLLAAGDVAMLVYDAGAQRWRAVRAVGVGAGQ